MRSDTAEPTHTRATAPSAPPSAIQIYFCSSSLHFRVSALTPDAASARRAKPPCVVLFHLTWNLEETQLSCRIPCQESSSAGRYGRSSVDRQRIRVNSITTIFSLYGCSRILSTEVFGQSSATRMSRGEALHPSGKELRPRSRCGRSRDSDQSSRTVETFDRSPDEEDESIARESGGGRLRQLRCL